MNKKIKELPTAPKNYDQILPVLKKYFPYIREDFYLYENLYDTYYHLLADLIKYPLAWCYMVWSKRGPGKTYSALWLFYYCKVPFIYMKRTDKDVHLILSEQKDLNFDPCPYAPLKRDKQIRVVGAEIDAGIGAFYVADNEGEPTSQLLCYVLSFNKVQKYKGFDFSSAEAIIFDEFIPQKGERCLKSEGENLLDLYMTVRRDRAKRGRPSLKLILFANAEEIAVPVTRELETLDMMAYLNSCNDTHYYMEDRRIMLHHITNDEVPIRDEEMDDIYIGMKGTQWWDKAFNGHFTHNDFTNVMPKSLKRCKPILEVHHRTSTYYIYLNEEKGFYYMSTTPAKCRQFFDLNRENEQKRFYLEWALDLREACIEERFKFEKYSMYDLIINYKKYFEV